MKVTEVSLASFFIQIYHTDNLLSIANHTGGLSRTRVKFGSITNSALVVYLLPTMAKYTTCLAAIDASTKTACRTGGRL